LFGESLLLFHCVLQYFAIAHIIPIPIKAKRSPGCKPGLLGNYASQEVLGNAVLTLVLFFVLTLSGLLVRVILLLLAALLAGLATMLTLSELSTLLLLIHIVCHRNPPSHAAQALRI
jgi:hypothetical protein